MKKKITTIIGTRPEIIKMWPIIKQIDKYFDNQLVWSGQHYDFNMVKNIFKDLNLRKPDKIFKIKKKQNTFFEIQKNIRDILKKQKPLAILYHGDTLTTLACALVSRFFYPKLLNVHIEGGYRSYDNLQIEEQIRFVSDHLSKISFVQRKIDYLNLKKENNYRSYVVGNSVNDSIELIKKKNIFKDNYLYKMDLKKKDYIYCTIHREENVDNIDRLNKIIKIIKFLSLEKKVVFSIHPRTKLKLKKNCFKKNQNVILTPPLKYSESILLLSNCYFCMSDSGGLQEEAIILKKRCLIPLNFTPHNFYLSPKANKIINLNSKTYMLDVKSFLSSIKINKSIKKFYHAKNVSKNIVRIIQKNV